MKKIEIGSAVVPNGRDFIVYVLDIIGENVITTIGNYPMNQLEFADNVHDRILWVEI